MPDTKGECSGNVERIEAVGFWEIFFSEGWGVVLSFSPFSV